MCYRHLLACSFVVGASVSSLACSGAGGAEVWSVADAGADAPVTTSFTLDLTSLPGGLQDANSSVAFPIDVQKPIKVITKLEPAQLVEIYDRVGCWSGSEGLLETQARGARIPPGDAVVVRSIDVVLTPPQIDSGKGLCYGYRGTDGAWHYDLTPVEPTLDPATGLLHAHVVVRGGPMDALEIPFASHYPPAVVGLTFEIAR